MPPRIVEGKRVARQAHLRPGCYAAIFDASRTKILLTRRADNRLWCLPGGKIEPGESVAEACLREVREETGLQVRVVRLIGVYSSPDWMVEYPDGRRTQAVALCFEAVIEGGALGESCEVCEFGYFDVDEAAGLALCNDHYQRIQDAFAQQDSAFIR